MAPRWLTPARMAGPVHFETIEEVQQIATEWLWFYDNERPNMGNGGIALVQKLTIAA